MKKIVIQCVGNILLFALFGLTFLFPFSNFVQVEPAGFSGTLTIFPVLLGVFLVAYPFANYFLKRIFKIDKKSNSELDYSDEREKTITAAATQTAYKVLVGGLLVCTALIGGTRFYSLFTHTDISIYFVSILLLTVLLIVAMLSYCVKWGIEYRR